MLACTHTHTHTHTWILYYILIDTHAYRECILINRAQTQRSVPAPIGRHLAALQSSYRLFFYLPPSPYHYLYLYLPPLPVSAPFMLAFIYLLAAAPVRVAFSIFRLQIGKVQTQNTVHIAECSIEMATGRSPSLPFEGILSSRHRRQADRDR